MRKRKAIGLTLACLALMGLVTVLSGRLPTAESNLERYLHISGRIVGEAVMVQSRCQGVIETLPVREGERVEPGTLLLRVVDADVQARLAELEGLIEELEQEKLVRLEHLATLQPFGQVSLEMAEAGALFAAVDLSLAETAAGAASGRGKRSTMIIGTGEIEKARQRYEAAVARLTEVRAILIRIEQATREISFVEIQLEELLRERRGLRFHSRQGEILSREEACLGTISVAPGMAVSEGQELLSLIAVDSLRFEGLVPRDHAAMLRIGDEVLVFPHPLGNGPFVGMIERVRPHAERVSVYGKQGRTEQYEVYRTSIRLTEGSAHLSPDQRAEAIIPLRQSIDRNGPIQLAGRLISRSSLQVQ